MLQSYERIHQRPPKGDLMQENDDGEDDNNDNDEVEQHKVMTRSFNSQVFLTGIYFCRICQGLYLSIYDPTLLFLAENTNNSIGSMAPIFTGRNIGFVAGCLITGYVLKWKNPLLLIGIGLFISGILLVLIPFVKVVALLVLIITVTGFFAGILDTGLQGLILNIWGEKDSRSLIQGFHFAYTIGAFIAPLIVKPFLEMASMTSDPDANCPGKNKSRTPGVLNNGTVTHATPPATNGDLNPIAYAYVISSVFVVSVSIFFIILACLSFVERIKMERKGLNVEIEERPEEPLKKVFVLFFLLSFYYFCLAGGEGSYITLLYAVSVCSDLHFSETDATLLNSLFWGFFGFGRLACVFVSKYLKPKKIMLICLIGSLLSTIVISLFGQHSHVVMWTASAAYGFFSSPLFPSAVSWVSNLSNISGKYTFIVNLGSGIGGMILVTTNTIIFQRDPFRPVYFITGMVGLNCLVFIVMTIYARKRRREIDLWKFTETTERARLIETAELLQDNQ